MADIKHTPGPWTYSRWDEHGYTRFYVAQAEGAPYTPDYSDVSSMVTETVSGERVAVQEANASLISAAPEMFALIELFVETITEPANADHTLGAYSHGARIADARRLIAKITGA